MTPAPVYANNTNAGTATASYSFAGDTNHTGSNDSEKLHDRQGGSTTDVTCTAGPSVYAGSAYTPCSVSVTGAGAQRYARPGYANNTNAGTATASYSFAGDTNHTGSNDSENFTIDKASSTTNVTCTRVRSPTAVRR
jgi:hypothetical protein